VPADAQTSPVADTDSPRPTRHFLCTALCVAALANAFVPAVIFGDSRLFPHDDPRYRMLVAAVVLVEYAIVFLLILLHANVGFASGYAATTAAIVTLGSALLAAININPGALGWASIYEEVLDVGGLSFAVLSNAIFLWAAVRYARAIHPRMHLGGFLLGVAASFAVVFLYVRMFH
jgi:hypothetical protein